MTNEQIDKEVRKLCLKAKIVKVYLQPVRIEFGTVAGYRILVRDWFGFKNVGHVKIWVEALTGEKVARVTFKPSYVGSRGVIEESPELTVEEAKSWAVNSILLKEASKGPVTVIEYSEEETRVV